MDVCLRHTGFVVVLLFSGVFVRERAVIYPSVPPCSVLLLPAAAC